jgi:hypothetical protein
MVLKQTFSGSAMALASKVHHSTSVIIMEFITDDLWGFVDWYISEKIHNIKANESI